MNRQVGSAMDPMFQSTIQGLEAGLHVRLVATYPFLGCDAEDNAARVVAKFSKLDIDYVPVAQEGVIVGVLECEAGARPRERTRERMKPLDSSMLISGTEPLETFLPLMRESRYRLVVHEGDVRGIVTRSDLLKLPVRLFAFCLLSHLEICMAKAISGHSKSWNDWKHVLPEDRRKDLTRQERRLRKSQMNPDMLELTYLREKCEVLRHLGVIREDVDEFSHLNELRNDIAHAKNFAHDREDLLTFLDRLEIARQWIDTLNRHVEGIPGGYAS